VYIGRRQRLCISTGRDIMPAAFERSFEEIWSDNVVDSYGITKPRRWVTMNWNVVELARWGRGALLPRGSGDQAMSIR